MTQETFERELARRAERVHGAPLSFDDVRGRAVSIRRRRRGAVAGGVAAAVALAVLVPTILIGGNGPGSDAPEPAPPVPGHTAVLHDGTLTLPDGGEVALDVDNADVQQLGLLTDGRIVLATSEPYGVRVFGADGTLQADYPARANAITMSATDDAVAWVAEDFTIRVLASGAAEPRTLPGIPMPGEAMGSIDAVLAPDRLLVGDWNTTTGEVTPDGYREISTSEPLRVTDVSPADGLWAVQYADDADPQFGCVGVYDPDAAEMVARNCESSGLRFSPDGEHLLGMRGDNNMFGDATVLDLDLERVGGWESGRRGEVIHRSAWADSEHLLVSEADWQTNTWTLARVDLAWTDREVLDGPADGRNPEMVAEFLLSE